MIEKKNAVLTSIETNEYYSLNVSDFVTQVEPEEYKRGDKVTRKNFVSMLMDSFAFSRGKKTPQWFYFEWLKMNTGFNYIPTLENFVLAGGWVSMNDKERAIFIEKFQRVKEDKIHTPATENAWSMEKILGEELGEMISFFNNTSFYNNKFRYSMTHTLVRTKNSIDIVRPFPLAKLKYCTLSELKELLQMKVQALSQLEEDVGQKLMPI